MSDLRFQDQFAGAVRTGQIIVMALAVGCLTFAVVAVVLNAQNGPMVDQADLPMVTYLAVAFAATTLVAFFVARGVLPGLARRSASAVADRQSETSATFRSAEDVLRSSEVVHLLLQGRQTRLIVSAALLEGSAFFLLIAYMMEGRLLALAAAVVLVLGILLQFPTRSRVAAWILRQAELIHNQRQFSQR